MSKLSYKVKINIYLERKNGNTINTISKKYNVRKDVIKYLVKLIDKHGYNILRTSKNRKFTSYEKEQIINRVLINNESAYFVAIDEGKRERSPTMQKSLIKNGIQMLLNLIYVKENVIYRQY